MAGVAGAPASDSSYQTTPAQAGEVIRQVLPHHTHQVGQLRWSSALHSLDHAIRKS